jgi:5-methylcytosine-specific restriction endonuclease McrA
MPRQKISSGRRTAVYIRDRATCECCGYRPQRAWDAWQMEIDHVVPVARGGTSAIENLQVLCSRCNNRKGGMTMEEFEDVFWTKLGEVHLAERKRYGHVITPTFDQGWL